MPRRVKRKIDVSNPYNLRRRASSTDSDSVMFVSASKRKQDVLQAKKQIFNRMQSLAIGRGRGFRRRFMNLATQTDETSFNCLCCERNSCSCLPGPSRNALLKPMATHSQNIQMIYENERCINNKDTQTLNAESGSEVLRTVDAIRAESQEADSANNSEQGYSADISTSDTMYPESNQHTVGVSTSEHRISGTNSEELGSTYNRAQLFGRTGSEPIIDTISESATTSSGSVATVQNGSVHEDDGDNAHGQGDGSHNDPLQVEIIDLGDLSMNEYLENLR